MLNVFSGIINDFDRMKQRLLQFAATQGESKPGGMLTHEPMLHSVLSDTEENASKFDITTDEGVAAIKSVTLVDRRFREWMA